tara:strand:- start:175 stop:534 length:360 start_codon:yes stop_codon:yes gene_type:complete
MALSKTSLSPIISIVSANTKVGIITNASGEKLFIKSFVLHNAGVSTATTRLYDVANSSGSVGSASTNNQFFSQNILGGETVFLEYSYPLTLTGTNDSIRIESSTTGPVNVQIIGDKDPG